MSEKFDTTQRCLNTESFATLFCFLLITVAVEGFVDAKTGVSVQPQFEIIPYPVMLADNFVGLADIGANGIPFLVAGKFVRRTAVAIRTGCCSRWLVGARVVLRKIRIFAIVICGGRELRLADCGNADCSATLN